LLANEKIVILAWYEETKNYLFEPTTLAVLQELHQLLKIVGGNPLKLGTDINYLASRTVVIVF